MWSIINNIYNLSDINECSSNPCENNATCVDQVTGYTCTCQAGYTRNHCDIGICLYIWKMKTEELNIS